MHVRKTSCHRAHARARNSFFDVHFDTNNAALEDRMNYELLYFNGAGRAEAIRLMLHAGGIEFDDKRIGFQEWPEIKETTPLGAVPVLKIDGVSYCQSTASVIAMQSLNLFPKIFLTPFASLMTLGSRSVCGETSRLLPRRSSPGIGG